jgi:hypothetical protein
MQINSAEERSPLVQNGWAPNSTEGDFHLQNSGTYAKRLSVLERKVNSIGAERNLLHWTIEFTGTEGR